MKNLFQRKSNLLLLIGGVILVVGAVLSLCDIEPIADYVLVAGALVVIARGMVREREKDEPRDAGQAGE